MDCQRCQAHTDTYDAARLAVRDIYGNNSLRLGFSDLVLLCPNCVAELHTWLQTEPTRWGKARIDLDDKLEVPGGAT